MIFVAGRKGTKVCANSMSVYSSMCVELSVPLADGKQLLGPTTNFQAMVKIPGQPPRLRERAISKTPCFQHLDIKSS